MQRNKTRKPKAAGAEPAPRFDSRCLTLCALFAALTAGLSQISIPIGPVPVNLALISVFVAAGLLGARYGALSQAVFVLMGAVGLPVFAGFMGGLSRVAGPTGGYIVGYIACAFIAGAITGRFGRSMIISIAAMCAGLIVTYTLGTLWYSYVMDTGFVAALMTCVVPFLLGDALKIVLSAALVKRLSPYLQRKGANAG